MSPPDPYQLSSDADWERVNVNDLPPEELLGLLELAARAARKAGAEDDSADIAHDTIRKLDDQDIGSIANLEAWVQKVAKNAAIDLHRRAERITQFDDDKPGLTPRSFTTKFVATKKIQDLVAGLPDKYRDVVRLTYYEGLSAAEVGERTGYGTATVHKMLSEARSMLRPDITAPPGYER